MVKCPGQDSRYWKPDDVFETTCPACGQNIEFFKDDPKRKCPKCGQTVTNPKIDLGCAQWCQYAEQCLGVSAGSEADTLCAQLIQEMKAVFGSDTRRIDHALAVLSHAEQIQSAEGGDPLIVKAAAILHDIGILQAERNHGSSAGAYQEIEGPPIARPILQKYQVADPVIDHICNIIANHHSAKDIDTKEFNIVWDADWLVNFPDEHGDQDPARQQEIVNKVFRTGKGRQLASELLIDQTG